MAASTTPLKARPIFSCPLRQPHVGIRLTTPPSKPVVIHPSVRNNLDTVEDLMVMGSRISDICADRGLFEPGPGAPFMRSMGALGLPLGFVEVSDSCKKLERAQMLEDGEAETAAKLEIAARVNLALRSAAIGASTILSIARTELPPSSVLTEASKRVSGAWSSFSTINAIIGLWNRGSLLYKIHCFKKDLKNAGDNPENKEAFLRGRAGVTLEDQKAIRAEVIHRLRSKLPIYKSKTDYFYNKKLESFAQKWGKQELARRLKEAGYEEFIEGANFKHLFCTGAGWQKRVEDHLVAEEVQKRRAALEQMVGKENIAAILDPKKRVDLEKIAEALCFNPLTSAVSFESGFKFFLFALGLFIAAVSLLALAKAIVISAPFSLALLVMGLAVGFFWMYWDGKQLFESLKSGNTLSCRWGLFFNVLYMCGLLVGRILGKVTGLDFALSGASALIWFIINLAGLGWARAHQQPAKGVSRREKRKAAQEMRKLVQDLVQGKYIAPCKLKK